MLSLGIVGLPNVGKSTLFNALLGRELAPVGKHPFTTIDKNTGVVSVPDRRLSVLKKIAAELAKTPSNQVEVTPATIKFIDIAGLVKGAHKGEGLGNEFLGYIREVDAIVHVLRSFDSDIPHVMKDIDPLRDLEVVKTELILKDLETIEKTQNSKLDFRPRDSRGRKLATQSRQTQNDSSKLKAILEKVKKGLDNGVMVKDQDLTDKEKEENRDLFLLTEKPTLYVLNVAENQLTVHAGKATISDFSLAKKLKEKLGSFLIISAQLESELNSLSQDEAKAYLAEIGIKKSGLDKIVRQSHEILDLLTFFTIAKGKKVCAWSLKKGKKALEAAASVHSDFARGFIKAQVISFKSLAKIGSWLKAQKMGKIKIVGRDYQVSDGDVIEFKFSV